MQPLPPEHLGVITTVHNKYSSQVRPAMARDAIKIVHGIEVAEEDLKFVYGKLDTYCPALLRGVPANLAEPLEIWPSVTSCPYCGRGLGSHCRRGSLTAYGSTSGGTHGTAIEQHCDACSLFFMGQWSYRRHDKRCEGAAASQFRYVAKDVGETFLLPTKDAKKAHACTAQDLRLVSGTLHHARGSFTAAADIFADTSDQQLPTATREVLEALWFAWALVRFLPPDAVRDLDWTNYWDKGRTNDRWLQERKALVRAHFVKKWALEHVESCSVCRNCFAIGLDGKRGMKRFLCACLDGEPLEVPELKAWVAQGCTQACAVGSIYCKEHDYLSRLDTEEAGSAGTILQHRGGQDGGLQYLVEEIQADGSADRRWVPAHAVGEALRTAYAVERLPESTVRGSPRKQRARTGANACPPESEHVLAEDENDKGACEIDKAKEGIGPKKGSRKVQRRRLGGIIAAVSGCRVVLDWDEHQFGEGTGQVYIVLARLVSAVLAGGGRAPDAVFMDNACALRKYAINPKRRHRTDLAGLLAELHYILDVWHVRNHSACLADEESARILDPRHEDNKILSKSINTEACEQCFSFLDRVTYVGLTMGPGHFAIFLYLIFDMENAKVVRRRGAQW